VQRIIYVARVRASLLPASLHAGNKALAVHRFDSVQTFGGFSYRWLIRRRAIHVDRADLSSGFSQDFGLGIPIPWLSTIVFATAWLAGMLVYGPLADRIATRWFTKPRSLGAFRIIQQSTIKLIAGIIIAWALGAFLEELTLRGIVLKTIEAQLSRLLPMPIAAAISICVAAAGAGIIHLYQGPRAAFIITQLSTLCGLLFVLSTDSLWAVILSHGMYDTIAFIRFRERKIEVFPKFAGDRDEQPLAQAPG